jgi:hypothetical protein
MGLRLFDFVIFEQNVSVYLKQLKFTAIVISIRYRSVFLPSRQDRVHEHLR